MSAYFRNLPNFDYVSRDPNQRQISEYTTVKNFFKRGKLKDDIFGNLAYFTKYKIVGDDRPDNVAYQIYGDETLDWVILVSNNILNIQSEWPMTQTVFDKVMLEKYGSYEELYGGIHHYETQEIKDSLGNILLYSGIKIPKNWKSGSNFLQGYKTNKIDSVLYSTVENKFLFTLSSDSNLPFDAKVGTKLNVNGFDDESINGSYYLSSTNTIEFNGSKILQVEFYSDKDPESSIITLSGSEYIEFVSQYPLKSANTYYYQYYDNVLESNSIISADNILIPVTNYEYEIKIEEEKRNIFILKPNYLSVVFNDLEDIMEYRKDTSQYISRNLKRGDNIRLYK